MNQGSVKEMLMYVLFLPTSETISVITLLWIYDVISYSVFYDVKGQSSVEA